MTAADAPKLPFCPSCGNRDWHGPYCRVCKTDLTAKLAAAERERDDAKSALDYQIQTGRLHDHELREPLTNEELAKYAAFIEGGNVLSWKGVRRLCVTAHDAAARADRAEAALVAAQEAMREAAAKFIEGQSDRYISYQAIWRFADSIRALPIPAAKPEGE